MKRYLVKELIINEGEERKILPLYYIEISEGGINYFPFDKERAGFEYCDRLEVTG